MRTTIILLLFLLPVGVKVQAQQTPGSKEQTIARFKKDLLVLNKAYYGLKRATFAYTYSVYSDEAATKPIESFPLTIITQDERSYYKYAGTEILYDTAFTLVISHDDKRISLLKKQEKQGMSFESLIDTLAMNALLKKVSNIQVEKKNKITHYKIGFDAGMQLSAMSVSFDQAGLITQISVTTPKQEPASGTDPQKPQPAIMVISRKSYSPSVKQENLLSLSTYFKLFGNGQYILSDLYQSYNLNNLYENQDL